MRFSAVRKAFTINLIFSFSGLFHLLTDLQLGRICDITADLKFYVVNAAAMVFEGLVVQLLRMLRQSRATSTRAPRLAVGSPGALAARIVGHMWVAGFLCWATPKFYYPKMYCILSEQLAATET